MDANADELVTYLAANIVEQGAAPGPAAEARKFWKQLKPVYEDQLQFDTNEKVKLTATICRVAELTDPKEPDADPTYVYVPLVELATENPEKN